MVLSQLSYSPGLGFLNALPVQPGGAEGIRTLGLYSAIVALSQLSYSPADSKHYTGEAGVCQIAVAALPRLPRLD